MIQFQNDVISFGGGEQKLCTENLLIWGGLTWQEFKTFLWLFLI